MKMAYDVRKAPGRRNQTFAVVVEEVKNTSPLTSLSRFIDVGFFLPQLCQTGYGRAMPSLRRTFLLLEALSGRERRRRRLGRRLVVLGRRLGQRYTFLGFGLLRRRELRGQIITRNG